VVKKTLTNSKTEHQVVVIVPNERFLKMLNL